MSDSGNDGSGAGKIGRFSFRGSSSGASNAASTPTSDFHSFLQRRQPSDDPKTGAGSAVSSGAGEAGGSAAATARPPPNRPSDTSSSGGAASAGGPAQLSTANVADDGGPRGLLASLVPAVRDSPNYTPPVSIPAPSTGGASGGAAAVDAGGPSSQSQTPPSQPLPAGAGAAAGNRVLVHPRQKGNKLLDHIRNVPFEFNDSIVPDFLVGQRNCVTFLSLRYHKLHPEYVHGRLREMGRGYTLRVLLVLIDMADSDEALRELSRVAVGKGLSLLVASSEKEAGRYIETFKLYENKPADMLQGVFTAHLMIFTGDCDLQGARPDDYLSQLRSALTTVKSVNKTDTVTLLTTFGSLKDIMQASADDLRMCPGFGEQKAARLQSVFDAPFDTRQARAKGARP